MDKENTASGNPLSHELLQELLKDSVLLNADFWEDAEEDEEQETLPAQEQEAPPPESDPFQMAMPMEMPMEIQHNPPVSAPCGWR